MPSSLTTATANKTSKSILSIVLLRTLSWEFAFPIPPRLCFSAFTLAQPFLFHRIISGIENRDLSTAEMMGILAATALIYLGIGVGTGIFHAGACVLARIGFADV